MFESFYSPMNHDCLSLLKNDNVLWPEEDEAVCLFKRTRDWEIEIGPYLPAYFLKTSLEEYCYLVPDAIPCDCSEDVPLLGGSV